MADYMVFPNKTKADKATYRISEHPGGRPRQLIEAQEIDGRRYVIQQELEADVLANTRVTRSDYAIEDLSRAFFTGLWDENDVK